MLQRLVDELKESTGSLLRMTSLAAAVAISLFITTAFLSAAAFVFVLNKHGLMWACLTGAGIYAVVTAIAAGIYIYRQSQVKARPVEKTKSVLQSALADPMIMAAGLQVVRTIGFKRLIPLLAIGGIAVGLMTARQSSDEADAPAE